MSIPMKVLKWGGISIGAVVLGLAGFLIVGSNIYTKTYDTETQYGSNFEHVGYTDLDGRPGFKMAMQVVDDRWYLYVANFWHRGWTIVDVTDPANPVVEKFVPGPENTLTVNIQVADGLMVTALERPVTALLKYVPPEGYAWAGSEAIAGRPLLKPGVENKEGVWLWDVRDPVNPVKLGEWEGGATGTHRNFYAGGDYAWLAAHKAGFSGHQLVVLDVSDPAEPREVGSWYEPEQDPNAGIKPEFYGYYHHGPTHIEGDRAYVPYGVRGALIMDVADPANPQVIGRVNPKPDLGSEQGVHTFLPLPSRGLAIINSEAHDEMCRPDPGPTYAAMVDISDETNPRILSFFPEQTPPPEVPWSSFCQRQARAGVHNQHHHNNQPHLFQSDTLTFTTTFSAGLRLYDTSDPMKVEEIGYFIPPDPRTRSGLFPTRLIVQTEDVIVDARGYAYITQKNQGVHIVRSTHPAVEEALRDQPYFAAYGTDRTPSNPTETE